MPEFVDPRSRPEPPSPAWREPAAHGEELRDLVQLCSAGRVYDAERWIQSGRPIQALTYKRPGRSPVVSPLRTAFRKKHHDLVLLLLCNGYRLSLEADTWRSVLDEALEARAYDILEMLLTWGAPPTAVRGENVLDTYQTGLIDRFWRAGVDYTADRRSPHTWPTPSTNRCTGGFDAIARTNGFRTPWTSPCWKP